MKKIISMLLTIMMLFVCCNINIYATVEYKSYSGTETIQTRKYADEDYVFAVGSHKFTLLDAFDDSDSSYLIIANESYGSRTYKVDSFTSTATDSMNYWLNNTFDGLDVNIRQHIDFNHSWMIDPAPNATTPILQGTTFTAGITVPSVSELEEYGDKLGYADLGSHFGTRTVRNSTDTKNILVYQYETSDVNDTSWSLYCRSKPNIPIRPIFFVDEEFFADVKIDLTISGTTVKQEIAKLGIDTLKELYTEDEMITYLGFDESDFGGTNDNEPEDDNQETDDLYFTEKRTVNYDTPWDVNTFKTVTSQTADVDYVFTVKKGDSNESFTLLDVDANGTASKYFVIANQAYGKAAIFNTNSDVANYWKNPTTEEKAALGNNTDDIAKKYATYWLDNQHFEKGWLLNEAAYKFGASPLVPYIDNAHVWTCEPTPAAAVPNEKYTFTAGIALPSASELDTYIDRLGIADVASFGTRTMINYKDGDNTYRYMGVASTTSTTNWYPNHWKLPQQGTVRIRPVCWLNSEFFANVKIDLATAGAAVKQEIAKLGIDALSELYTEEEMITYLGFNESDFGGTEDNNPEDDNPEDNNPESDGLYFAEERTVNYTAWDHYMNINASATAEEAAKYKFSLASNGDTFSLLDVKDNSASKYFVITDAPYMKKVFVSNTNANYFATEDGTVSYTNNDVRAQQYPSWALNGQYFEKGWTFDNYNGAKKKLDTTVRSYIDFTHIWTCEPAPNNSTPNEQYTTTAGIMYPSVSEVKTYGDRFLLSTDASFATRTMANYGSETTTRYIGRVTPNDGKFNAVATQAQENVRPCFWLNDQFFSNVKIDLATAGAAVKQEIAKLDVEDLLEMYSFEELKTYLNPEFDNDKLYLEVATRSGNEAEYGETLTMICNYVSESGYMPSSVDVNWIRKDSGKTITVGNDKEYVISEADADTGTASIYCEIKYNNESGEEVTVVSQEFAIPSIGVEPHGPNEEWAMADYADDANKFSLEGKSFTLIDSFDNDESMFFVTTNDNYGDKTITSVYMDPEDDESYIHWLNSAFRVSGNLVNEEYVKIPDAILSYINYEHTWLTEAAPNNAIVTTGTKEEMAQNYTFKAGMAPLSASELYRYKDVIGSTENVGNSGKFTTRTAANWSNSSAPELQYILVSAPKSDSSKIFMNHWELPSGAQVRPAFYLTKDFFKNVELDFDYVGENVLEVMKNNYYIEDLESIYDYDNLVDLGFVSKPDLEDEANDTLMDLGGAVEIEEENIDESFGVEIPIFAIYTDNKLESVTYDEEAGFNGIKLTEGQKAKAMLWDSNMMPLTNAIVVNYGEPINVANVVLGMVSDVRGNNFIKGSEAVIKVKTNGDFFSYRVTDYWGNVVKEFEHLAQLKTYQPIDFSELDAGYYELSIYSSFENETPITTTSFSILDEHEYLPADSSPFGMNIHSARTNVGWNYGLVKECYSIGAMTIRDDYEWKSTESQTMKGTYKYNYPCADLIQNRDMDYIIITGYNHPLYDSNMTPYTDEGRTGFANYSKALFDLYPQSKGGLTNMEVFNEFWGPKGKLNGSPANSDASYYVEIAKEVYETVKPEYPGSVLFGEFGTENWNQEVVDEGICDYMDAAAIHLYPGYKPVGEDRATIPEESNMVIKYNNAKSLIEGEGKTADIWVTETGMNTALNGHYNYTEQEQAMFLPRTHFLLLEAGAKKVLWYDLLDDGNDKTSTYSHEYNFGLLHAKGSDFGIYTPKPAYVAYGIMTRVLDGTSYDSVVKSGTKYCYLFKGDEKCVSAVYDSTNSSTVKLSSTKPFTATDLMGKTTSYEAGTHTIEISGSVIYITGEVEIDLE